GQDHHQPRAGLTNTGQHIAGAIAARLAEAGKSLDLVVAEPQEHLVPAGRVCIAEIVAHRLAAGWGSAVSAATRPNANERNRSSMKIVPSRVQDAPGRTARPGDPSVTRPGSAAPLPAPAPSRRLRVRRE